MDTQEDTNLQSPEEPLSLEQSATLETLSQAETPQTEISQTEIQPTETLAPPESFLSKNKLYIVGGIVGIVVITIVTGVFLSMGSSSRLQGMLDKRLMEQTSETNTLPESLNKTETFTEVSTEALVEEEAPVILEVETSPALPKGPTIKPVE